MRIGIDAKRAFMNSTGLGNYCRNILFSLLEADSENEYFLFTPRIRIVEFEKSISTFKNVKIITSTSFFDFWFRSFSITNLLKKLNIDIYHGLSNELPFTISKFEGKKIVTIHDLIPFKEDVFVKIPEIFIYRLKLKSAIKSADTIIAISNQTKEDINRIFGNQNIKVIYQPYNHIYNHISQEKIIEVKNKFQLPDKYFLQVGRMEYRKNIQQVLEALKLLGAQSQIHFVCVGKKTRFTESLVSFITNFKLINKVHFYHNISTDELQVIYKLSSFCIYPSKYEGFGIPILEAIFHHKRVITTKGGCFAEAGGSLANYVDILSANDIATEIIKLEKNSIELSGREEHLNKFTPSKIAKEIIEIYLHKKNQ